METDEKVENNQDDIVSLLLARGERKGDLPVFNASMNNVRRISSDPESHAMELAQVIMKDANFSVKLLRVANSPFYSRGFGKISSVSRAVVLLGFDTIRSMCLTMKLIETFQDSHPAIGMEQLVARSYLTAGFVRDVGMKAHVKDVEQMYISGLCHNMGEIAVAYFLPEKFLEMLALQKSSQLTWEQIQEKVLGIPMLKLGQKLAGNWNFSSKVVNSMREYRPEVDGQIKTQEQLIQATVSLSSQIMDSLYSKHADHSKGTRELLGALADATGVPIDNVERSLNNSFRQSCELAKQYGLSQRALTPILADTGDGYRDKLAGEMAFVAGSQLEPAPSGTTQAETTFSGAAKRGERDDVELVKTADRQARHEGPVIEYGGQRTPPSAIAETGEGAATAQHAPSAVIAASTGAAPSTGRGDPLLQLSIIQEITTMVTEAASLNTLFIKILEGLHRGVGFDRSMLCLMTPDRQNYMGRIALGRGADDLKSVVVGKVNSENDIFARVLREGSDVVVENIYDKCWQDVISDQYREKSGATAFIAAGVRSGNKPLGFFYADNGTDILPITPEMRRGFMQFLAQARLAIQIRSGGG